MAKRLSTLTVKTIGDWNGVINFFSSLGINVKKEANKASFEACKKLKAIVVAHLLAQDLNWEPLSKSTKESKKKNKNLILIDTELYLNNIHVWKEGGVSKVGVKKGVSHKRKDNTISLNRLAVFLEFGTTKMPARPLWQPSIEEMGGVKGIRNFVALAIYERVKKLAKGKPLKITKSQILKKVR